MTKPIHTECAQRRRVYQWAAAQGRMSASCPEAGERCEYQIRHGVRVCAVCFAREGGPTR